MTTPIAMLNPETAAPILDCSPEWASTLASAATLNGKHTQPQSWQDAPTKPGMWACLYMGELSTAIFNAYEIEHFDAAEMGGCRWKFIPEDNQ